MRAAIPEGPYPPASVAAVIVNFNYAQFLPDAVDSVLGQHDAFEQIIVVDDGSTDSSAEVLAGYGDRIRVLRIANSGQLAASLAGLELVTTDYVYFLDADDYASPALRGSLNRACAGRPVKIQFQLRGVDEQGAPLDSVFPAFPARYSSEQMQQDNQRLGFYICPPTSGNVYRTETLRALPLSTLAPRDSTDGTIAQVMPYLGAVATLPEVLASYRVHGASDSQQARPVPKVLRRDLDRFRRRWAEAEQLVPGLSAPRPGTTMYEAEIELLMQALDDTRPSLRTATDYARHVVGARMQFRSKVLLVGWTAALEAAGTGTRRNLVYAKRSSANRGSRLNSVLRVVLRRNRPGQDA